MLGEVVLMAIATTSSWLIAKNFISKKVNFETSIRNRFLQCIEEMPQQPLTNSNLTFGLEDIKENELGFEARLIIPIGLCEDNFIKIIPFLENAFSSDIEYKSYHVKFLKRSC
ncbi:hypothetical protein [Clostridium perfringens]|uniref:hypothetical protein n=1 Tax=Clostridium perfringens TaxID=1502 RepID=UPI0039E80F2C